MFAFSTAPLAYSRECPCSLLGQSRYPDVAGYPELPAYLVLRRRVANSRRRSRESRAPKKGERAVSQAAAGGGRAEVERRLVKRTLEDEDFRAEAACGPQGNRGAGAREAAARGRSGKGGRGERRHHLPGASQRLSARRRRRDLRRGARGGGRRRLSYVPINYRRPGWRVSTTA